MRVVSLACSNTEIVWALGCASQLVGVDDHSDWPEELVANLPHVGPDLSIDLDRVSRLEPDLVLATLTVPGHERIIEQLEASGLRWIAPEPTSLKDVYRDIREIGGLLGAAGRAETVVEDMIAAMPPVEIHEENRPAVLIQWWPKPVISPGRASWVTDVIRLAGGRNPLEDDPVKSRPLEDAEVAMIAPEIVGISWCGVHPSKYRPDVVYQNPAFASVPAITDEGVVSIPEAYLGRPGPRLVEGYRAIRRALESLSS